MTTVRATAVQLVALGLIAAVLAATSGAWRRAFPVWTDARAITYEQAMKLGSAVIWVDARAEQAYRQGHWPGAIHLTERAWDAGMERFLTAWQPDQTIVIYCDSGGCRTGHHVSAHLERDLRVQTRVLVGGWGVLQQHRAVKP